MYNWGYNSSYGGEKHQVGNPKFSDITVNFVNNYYKPGPATDKGKVSYRIVNPGSRGEGDYGKWYVSGNVIEGNKDVSSDNWNGGVQVSGGDENLEKFKLDKPWDAMKINEQTPAEAYEAVLAGAGCCKPKRDAVDSRIIEEVRSGKATFEGDSFKKRGRMANSSLKSGIIDSPDDVGGWPVLKIAPAPADSDHDGMPDTWELNNGLNPNDPADGSKISSNGYTNLENYLNSLCL